MLDICNFFYELGNLQRVKREGWKLFGIKEPEIVAEHSLRAAQIGYILAKLENFEKPEEVCTLLVFHDICESRIGDIHNIAKRYIKYLEEQVVTEQVINLNEIGEGILSLWKQAAEPKSKAGVLAKEADLIEMAITAKEYLTKGHLSAKEWLDNIENKIQTKSGKKILETLVISNPDDWWKNLKKF